MRFRFLAVVAMLGLAIASLAAHAPSAAAQDNAGSLIIGVATCPEGYAGDNYAEDCTTPAEGIDFALATPHTDNVEMTTSRGDGLVTFSLANFDLNPEGPNPVVVGEPAAEGLDYAVFCSKNGGEALDFSYETIDFEPGGPLLGISFEFETGDEIACEWYNIPAGGGDDVDDGEDVEQLPSTGAGTTALDTTRQLGLISVFASLLALAGLATWALRRSAA
ncbi:MAG TPA: hypothetical protein VIL01_07595 [Thermomicrobiales bacterium]